MIKEEGATFIYDKDGNSIGLIKLDEASRKKIIYKVEEADIEFITSLIQEKFDKKDK